MLCLTYLGIIDSDGVLTLTYTRIARQSQGKDGVLIAHQGWKLALDGTRCDQ